MRYQLSHACPTLVICVVDDPDHDDRVIVTTANHGRANMSVAAFLDTCRLAPGAWVSSDRLIEW